MALAVQTHGCVFVTLSIYIVSTYKPIHVCQHSSIWLHITGKLLTFLLDPLTLRSPPRIKFTHSHKEQWYVWSPAWLLSLLYSHMAVQEGILINIKYTLWLLLCSLQDCILSVFSKLTLFTNAIQQLSNKHWLNACKKIPSQKCDDKWQKILLFNHLQTTILYSYKDGTSITHTCMGINIGPKYDGTSHLRIKTMSQFNLIW